VSELNSRELLRLYQEGCGDAASEIFDRYVARLLALVRGRIGGKLRRRIDADDVVQSAYRSFFVHAKCGAYQLAESGDLWRLLAGIALNKLHGQIEKQTAAKRSIRAELPTDELAAANVAAREPTAAEVVALAEEVHLAIGRLSDQERQVVTSHLQGQGIAEISAALEKSERTVRRLLASAREKIEQRLLAPAPAELPVSLPADDHDAPLRYSDYVLENLMGAGGMGKVFRAREVRTGKVVAVKALHKSRQADARAVAQFVQESKILATLRHPNIVGVQGLGRFPGGGYFIVMDFADGMDLQTRLKSGPLPVSEALTIVSQVAAGVGYAHENGIVHCDLKPGNILLGKDGRALVTDFGFAHVAATTAVNFLDGIGGTLGYIAPEVLQLQSKPTPAADVYAIGVLLWALVSGKSSGVPTALENGSNEFAAVATIVKRCLAKSPFERYRTAKELQAQINLVERRN
jgi:eukaryotic-like serine/threonine-protein kinase